MMRMESLPPPATLAAGTEAPAFFLDLDGTLAAIERRPDHVRVPSALIAVLDRLATAADGAVAILSGRSLEQIDALLAPLLLPAAGLHGGDLRFAGGRRLRFEPPPFVRGVVRGALTALALPEGAWIEDKSGVAFALHYRDAPEAGEGLFDQAAKIVANTHGSYAVQRGRRVVELKPAGHTKGTALRRLMESEPFVARTPIVVGDDLTDEDAFAEAQRWGGSAVVVGERIPTCADFRLDSPAAVHAWLAAVTSHLEASAPVHARDDAERTT